MEIKAPALATTSSWFIEGVVELSSTAGFAAAGAFVLLTIVPGLGIPVFLVAAVGATAVPLTAALGAAFGGESSVAAAAFGAAFLGVPFAPALMKKKTLDPDSKQKFDRITRINRN
jgi:hypothetical protein